MDRENTPPQFRDTAKSLHLHQEIIKEILSRLPVKSLLRLRCVSKSWRCLIGSERFIKTQLDKSRNYQNYARWHVIFNCNLENPVPGLKRCSKLSYLDDSFVDPSPIDDPTNNHLLIGSNVVGHCNGLLCILKQPGCLFLWNPTTRISIELPKLDLDVTKFGFGWDEQSDAYKVFALLSRHNDNGIECIGKVYSSKTNSWKTVDHGSLDLHDEAGEFICGKIHWPTPSGYIETFDLKSDLFGMIELPWKPEPSVCLWLAPQSEPEEERGACLRVVCDDDNNQTRTVWKMMKYGMKESWVKVSTGTGPIPSNDSSTCAVWKIDKGEVKFSPLEKVVGFEEMFYYIESLVVPPLPDRDGNGSRTRSRSADPDSFSWIWTL